MGQNLLTAICAIAAIALGVYAYSLNSSIAELTDRETAAIEAKSLAENAAKQAQGKVAELEAAVAKAKSDGAEALKVAEQQINELQGKLEQASQAGTGAGGSQQ